MSPEEKAQELKKLLKAWKAEVFPIFKAKEIEHFSLWTSKNFRLTKSTGGSGLFEPYPYQDGLMILMTMIGLEKLVVFKSSQVGYTQCLLAWYFYETTHRDRSVIIWQPTDTDAREFGTIQLGSVLEDCPTIAEHLQVVTDGGKASKKDSDNTAMRRVFTSAIGYTLGAKSPNSFRRRSAPSLGMDEIDSMDLNVGEEGRFDKLAFSRAGGVNTFVKMVMGSTPTISGDSNIELISNDIETQLYRYFPCPHCGTEQVLEWGGLDTSFGIKWDNTLSSNVKKAKSCYYSCKGCKEKITYSHMADMDKQAKYKDVQQGIYLDQKDKIFRNIVTDEEVESPLEAVVYINSLMSYTFEWWRTTLEFLEAKDQLKGGDPSAMITWENHRMGMVHLDKGESNVKYTVLEQRQSQENYSINSLPREVEFIVGSADVQGDRLEYAFYGFGFGEECWVIDYHKVQGNVAASNVFEIMKADAERTFFTEDGRQLKVELMCIDSGYLPQAVYDFCSHEPQKYIPIKGSNQRGDADVVWPKTPTEGTYRVRLGTQAIKDVLGTRLTFNEIGAGYIHHPNDTDMFTAEYFKQLTAEKKILKRVGGKNIRSWGTKNKSVRNEPWDLLVYALAAIRILQRFYRKQFTAPDQRTIEARRSAAVNRTPVKHANLVSNPNRVSLEDVMNKMAGG